MMWHGKYVSVQYLDHLFGVAPGFFYIVHSYKQGIKINMLRDVSLTHVVNNANLLCIKLSTFGMGKNLLLCRVFTLPCA